MYDPPVYIWILAIGGPTAIATTTCVALYGGAMRAGLGRKRAALLTGAAALLIGGWFTATSLIAGRGWYDTHSGQAPWLAISALAFLGTLLALTRLPLVARTLATPGMATRLTLPQWFRGTGVFFLLYLALGHLPALFALSAGLGDIGTGIAAPLVTYRLVRGSGQRAAVWFNVYGILDLSTATVLGALTGYGLLNVTPSAAPISQPPLALTTTADLPLMLALHIASLLILRGNTGRVRQPGAQGLTGMLPASGR